MNPDLLYVQCDRCDGWYHTQCIGISIEEAEEIDQYFCYVCQNITGVSQISTISVNNKSPLNLIEFEQSPPINKKKKANKKGTFLNFMNTQGTCDLLSESFLEQMRKNASLKLSIHTTESSDKERANFIMEDVDTMFNQNIFAGIDIKDFKRENDLFESNPSEEEDISGKLQSEAQSDNNDLKSEAFPSNFNEDLSDLPREKAELDFQVGLNTGFQRDITQNLFDTIDDDFFKEDFFLSPGKPFMQEAFITCEFGGTTGKRQYVE